MAEYTVEYTDGANTDAENPDPTNYVSRAGMATVTYASGDVFEGSFNEELQKHGKGKYTFAAPQPEDDGEEPAPRSAAASKKRTRKRGKKKKKEKPE